MKSRLLGFLIAMLTAAPLPAQTVLRGDGRQAVKKNGIALVKPQKWSKPNEAVVMRFTAYTNRGGYFVLRSPSGRDSQVWVEQLVGGLPIPDQEIPADILNPSQRNALKTRLDSLKQLIAQVPSARIDIEQIAKPLAEAVKLYDAGQIRNNGRWEPANNYRAREFYLACNQLQVLIDGEADKSKIDLEENALFKEMLELSANDAALQGKVEDIRANLQKQIADQHQAEILQRLNNPNTPEADVPALVAELKSIKNPDQKITVILEQDLTARTLGEVIAKSKGETGVFFAGLAEVDKPPAYPPEFEIRDRIMAEQIEKFRNSVPPAAIRFPEEDARAIAEIANGLRKLQTLFEERNYSEAATLLNRMVPQAARIGPGAEAAFVSLKSTATKRIDLFNNLRAEGEVAEKEGNSKEAIAKFSAALEVSPNSDLSSKIEQLQKPAKKQP